MNKLKKSILSLTIALLSFAGVLAMAKPIPKIKNYNEFGQFANRYSANDFLSNKAVFGADEPGLLEVFLTAYNSLPRGVDGLARSLIRSKFGVDMTPEKLSQKLRSLDASKVIAVTVQQAQEIIKNISQDKSALDKQIQDLNGKIKGLEDDLARGGGAPDPALTKKLGKVQEAKLRLKQDLLNMTGERDALDIQIQNLKATTAPKTQLDALQKQKDAADAEIAQYQAIEKNLNARINALDKRIDDLTNKNPVLKAELIIQDYTNLAQAINDYFNNSVNINQLTLADGTSVSLADDSDIDAINDEVAINEVITKLEQIITAANDQTSNVFGPEFNNYADQWTKLDATTKNVKQANFDVQDQAVQKAFKQIADKLVDLNARAVAAEAQQQKILKQQQDKKEVAQLIKDLEEKSREYRNPEMPSDSTAVFPNITIEQFYNDPNLVNTINSVKTLKAGVDILDEFKKKSSALHAKLKKESNDLIAKARAIQGLDAPTQQTLNGAIQNLEKFVRGYDATPGGTDGLIKLITDRIDALLVDEIQDFIDSNLQNEAVAAKADLKVQNSIDLTDKNETELQGIEQRAGNLKSKYTELVDRFDAYKKAAAKNQRALNLLATADNIIAEMRQVITKATENEAAAQKAIRDIQSGGNGGGGAGPEVKDVVVRIDEDADEYKLSFKIKEAGKEYDFAADSIKTDQVNLDFARNIINISDQLITEAGEQITAKAKDQNDLTFIWSLILTRPYKRANELKNQAGQKDDTAINTAKEKIRKLVKPVFDAYTNKEAGVYKGGMKEYDL